MEHNAMGSVEDFIKLLLFGKSFFNESYLSFKQIDDYKQYLKKITLLNIDDLNLIYKYLYGDVSGNQLQKTLKTNNEIVNSSLETLSKDKEDDINEFIRVFNLSDIYVYGCNILNTPGLQLEDSPLYKMCSFFSYSRQENSSIYIFGTNLIFEIDELNVLGKTLLSTSTKTLHDFKIFTNTCDYAFLINFKYEILVSAVDCRYCFDSLLCFEKYNYKLTATPTNFYPMRLLFIIKSTDGTYDIEDMTTVIKFILPHVRLGYKRKSHYFATDVIGAPLDQRRIFSDNNAMITIIGDPHKYAYENKYSSVIYVEKNLMSEYITSSNKDLFKSLDVQSKYVEKWTLLFEDASHEKSMIICKTGDCYLARDNIDYQNELAINKYVISQSFLTKSLLGCDMLDESRYCARLSFLLDGGYSFIAFFNRPVEIINCEIVKNIYNFNETTLFQFKNIDELNSIVEKLENVKLLYYRIIRENNGVASIQVYKIKMFIPIGPLWADKERAQELVVDLMQSIIQLTSDKDNKIKFFITPIIVRQLQIFFYRRANFLQ